MKPLFAAAFLILVAHADEGMKAPRWMNGTVQATESKHRRHFDPHSAQIDVEILGENGVVYYMTLAYGIHKVDMIPGAGIVTSERRRSKTYLAVSVGDKVKFSVADQRGLLIDKEGVERKMLMRQARVAPKIAQ